MNEVKDCSIILMHDIHSPSVDAAEVLIPKLIASGYQLVTVSELAKYRSVAMYSGGVYNAFYRCVDFTDPSSKADCEYPFDMK